MRRSALALLLLLGAQAQAATITVFAASSLTEAFTDLGRAFQARTGHRAAFQFAGSATLRTQLQAGAKADVYASANTAQFEPLVAAGLLEPGQMFARNRLTVIARQGSSLRHLSDLVKPGQRIVIADRGVPAGDYTRQLLRAIEQAGIYGQDYSARFLRNVVSEEPNVRQVALKVQLGEADAAVVYASDVNATLAKSVQSIPLPANLAHNIRYPIGVVTASAQKGAARAFVNFVLSAEGQKILRQRGFLSP